MFCPYSQGTSEIHLRRYQNRPDTQNLQRASWIQNFLPAHEKVHVVSRESGKGPNDGGRGLLAGAVRTEWAEERRINLDLVRAIQEQNLEEAVHMDYHCTIRQLNASVVEDIAEEFSSAARKAVGRSCPFLSCCDRR